MDLAEDPFAVAAEHLQIVVQVLMSVVRIYKGDPL